MNQIRTLERQPIPQAANYLKSIVEREGGAVVELRGATWRRASVALAMYLDDRFGYDVAVQGHNADSLEFASEYNRSHVATYLIVCPAGESVPRAGRFIASN